ncbi:MAG: hypothetical protein JWN42_1474 [Candidatus Angelobacter sp.]|nr:hypothetical protein [Candidatus Angelobacter sp.]
MTISCSGESHSLELVWHFCWLGMQCHRNEYYGLDSLRVVLNPFHFLPPCLRASVVGFGGGSRLLSRRQTIRFHQQLQHRINCRQRLAPGQIVVIAEN